MKINQIIACFPEILKNHPCKFTNQTLEDLDTLLVQIDEQAEIDIIQNFKAWLKKNTQARDVILKFATEERELDSSPRPQPISEINIRQNLFELRKTNQEVLKSRDKKIESEEIKNQ
ncbi:hypothetical protein NIES4101_43750 [Calothrix sp. NIES-4101]|nr:hypothetical protein NIES4101_43750 [Calothrix sp. NIES-4101]